MAIEFSSKSGMNQEANVALCDFVLLGLLGTQLFIGVRGNVILDSYVADGGALTLGYWSALIVKDGQGHFSHLAT